MNAMAYPGFPSNCYSDPKTRELEFYSGSYNVADNDAAKSMLCNKTADVFLL